MMKRLLPSVTMAFLLATPFVVEAQRKGEPVAPATDEEYKQLAKLSEVVGKLGSAAGKSLSLVIESKQVSIDPTKLPQPNYQQQQPRFNQQTFNNADYNRQRQYMQIMQQMQEVQRIQDPNQRAQRYRSVMQSMQQMQMQMMQEQARQQQEAQRRLAEEMRRQAQQLEQAKKAQQAAIKVETTARSFDFNLRDDLVVRRMNLPFAYDDKGNVKQYTPEEIQKAKGDNPKLPGFAAKIEDLEGGQLVKLYIAPPKEGQVGGVDLVGNVIRPEVRVVVIMGDYDAAMGAGNKK